MLESVYYLEITNGDLPCEYSI